MTTFAVYVLQFMTNNDLHQKFLSSNFVTDIKNNPPHLGFTSSKPTMKEQMQFVEYVQI